MAGALRKTMVYLGLADEDYEAYDVYDEPVQPHRSAAPEREVASVTDLATRQPASQVVREPRLGGVSQITTIHPQTYNEAKRIGEDFREGTPVIMNLTDMSDADAKRLVDFAAGLVFGLDGSLERVTAKVFLLSPQGVAVASSGSSQAPVSGVFNQS